MSVKLALLKSGEQVISDIKELSSGDELKAYLFNNPHSVSVQKEIFLAESETINQNVGREYQIMLSPWILLTQDEDIIVNPDWIVSIVEPVPSLKKLYLEKTGVEDN